MLIGIVDTEVVADAFTKAINLHPKYRKFVLIKNFKTMQLINPMSQ